MMKPSKLYRCERGQALIESAIFLPMMFLTVVALIFFARIGVLSERAESAVRYGDLVSFRDGQAYSVSAVQMLLNNVVFGNSSSQLLNLCLAPGAAYTAPSPAATGVNADIRAALYENQVAPNSSATAPPTAKPFFAPDGVQQPSCSPGSINLNGTSPSGGTYKYPVGNLPLSITTFSITADVNLPSGPLRTILGGASNTCKANAGAAVGSCSTTTADMAFLNVAAPSTLIACVPGLSVILTVLNPLAGAPLCQ
jgi:hypothetical protein